AFIASLANRWNRNAEWAKKAVRTAESVTAETAVRIHAVDLEAPDLAALLGTVGNCENGVLTQYTTGLLRDRGSIPSVCGAIVGGVVTLILGELVLFDPSVPNARVSLWLVVGMAVAIGLFFAFVVKAVVSARRLPKPGGLEEMIGGEAVALTEIGSEGQVRAR